jgi:secondary thiamine-phosphate synthase enzyme
MEMKQATHRLTVATAGPGLYDVTEKLRTWLGGQGIATGLLTVFIQHTSASLTVQENADPDVLRDLDDFFRRLVPQDSQRYRHITEGPDDMPGHIRAALTLTQIAIPVEAGELALGTWQAVYVYEHRAGRFQRHLVLHLLGD